VRRLALLVVVVLVGCSAPAPPGPDPTEPSPSQAAGRLDGELRDAAWANDVDRARRLIASGADVNAKDATEQSAYLITTSEGYLELLEVTLAADGDVGALDSYNGTGLIRAADRGHAAVCGRLVRAGVDLDHVNRLGWTALHEAIILGDGSDRYVDTVRVLVAAGADLTLPSQNDQVRPLAHAEAGGHDRIARLLRAALADRTTGAEADQALQTAAAQGDADRVAIAVRAGADPAALPGRPADPAVARLLDHLGPT
jgi:ankyrin repeat protein